MLKEAESYGLHLTADNQLIDTVAGDVLPEGVALIKPIQQKYVDELTVYSVEELRGRVIQPGDRVYSRNALLCASLPGGGAELSLAIGYGMTEDRRQVPRIHEPHSFNMAWVRAAADEGLLRHRHDKAQVLLVKSGRWAITLNGDPATTVEIGPSDSFSVPEPAPGARSAASRPAIPVPASCSSSTPATTASTWNGPPRSSTPPATRTG